MKIAFVINSSWNIYNFRLGLIKALQSENHEIITIAPQSIYAKKLQQEGCTFYPVTLQSHGLNPIHDLYFIWQIVKILQQSKPDILICYTIKPNIYASWVARCMRIPVICNVTGLGTVFIRSNPLYKIAHWLYKFSFYWVQKVYFQNSDDYNLFIKLHLVSSEKSEIMPGSGVDLQKFLPQDAPKNSKTVFLLVSRMLKDKGIREYVAAIRMAMLQGLDAQFCMLGALENEKHSGINPSEVKQWQQEGLLQYLGFTDEVQPYYRNADCVVLPSYREGMPKSLLEAMAMGKPIITTKVPGCKELVEEGINGFLVEPKNSKQLAEAFIKFCKLPEEEKLRMGKMSRAIVESKYDEKFVHSRYIETINTLKKVNPHGI